MILLHLGYLMSIIHLIYNVHCYYISKYLIDIEIGRYLWDINIQDGMTTCKYIYAYRPSSSSLFLSTFTFHLTHLIQLIHLIYLIYLTHILEITCNILFSSNINYHTKILNHTIHHKYLIHMYSNSLVYKAGKGILTILLILGILAI